MEVGSHSRNTNLLLVAALTLVLLGLGLSFLTWQNLRQQRETLNKHMLLSARGILRGVEAGLIRDMRIAFRGGRRARDAQPQLKARAEELFKELASSGGVEFLALYGPGRKPAVTSWNPEDGDVFSLPDQAWESLSAHGNWIKLFRKKKSEILVAAVRSHPLLSALCDHDPGFGPPHQPRESPYLVVGIDTKEHLALYHSSRQAAFLQTGYVLLVAVFLWGLALGYLRRREQGKALQEDLAEAKKIGRLAAGLAHEIRNPLSAIRGFAQ
ncbi:MAG: histidine kinase dimerization/phospho-acceptor domain-containing protein, partial [Thermodesulfobacteriota bacterium]|nr:histidine kinase dimerization/phospho-acceptor domain-containing protein [Thermodesulfobacteriota bacterium]